MAPQHHRRPKLPTRFAPAERSTPDEIADQAQVFQLPWHLMVVLDTVPDFVMVLNEHRQVVFANRALRDLTAGRDPRGQRPGEILGCVHAPELTTGCGTTHFCSNCGAARAILSGLRGEENVQECRILLEGGGALDLRVWASPLEVDGRRYSVFVAADIGHEKRRYALERIFLHDLLNVVGSLYGFAHMLNEARDEKDRQFFIDRIISLANQLVSEIAAQQELVMAESSELSLTLLPVVSTRLLNDVAELYRAHETYDNRHIVLDPAAEPVRLTTDMTLLTRVIRNMVKNALEATPPGGAVTLGCRLDGDGVVFWVHNPGAMPREVQLQVFQRSFSTKGAGRGLGTYSIRLLTERYLGGQVWFVSSEEAGTTFYARYPLALG